MRKVLVGAALCAASLGAWAQASFSFTFNSLGMYTQCPQQACGGTVPFAFTGTALVETSSFADGTYTGVNLLQMRWDSFSLAGSFDIHDPLLTFFRDPSVTLLGGQIVAMTASNEPGASGVNKGFGNFTVFVSANLGQGTGVYANAPLIPAIPEPETWALMASGLALLGLARRRHAGKPVRPM